MMIDLSTIKEVLSKLSENFDLLLTAKLILVSVPVFTAFLTLILAVKEKRHRFSFLMTAVYLLLSAGFFAIAYGDAVGRRTTFKSVFGAAAVSVTMFIVLFIVYIFLFVASKPQKKKRFVAKIVEVPMKEVTEELKAFPLKGSADCREFRAQDVNYSEFTNFLQKINEKDLSFSDREEYNRIVKRAGFLSGVAVTDKTAPDFCETFASSIKLGAKYGIE